MPKTAMSRHHDPKRSQRRAVSIPLLSVRASADTARALPSRMEPLPQTAGEADTSRLIAPNFDAVDNLRRFRQVVHDNPSLAVSDASVGLSGSAAKLLEPLCASSEG